MGNAEISHQQNKRYDQYSPYKACAIIILQANFVSLS